MTYVKQYRFHVGLEVYQFVFVCAYAVRSKLIETVFQLRGIIERSKRPGAAADSVLRNLQVEGGRRW